MDEKELVIAQLTSDINRDAEMVRFHREESISISNRPWMRKYNAEMAAIYQESLETKMRLLEEIKR